jgi:ABC-type Mn2+/Zn2+ transport system permease subunit
MGALVIIPAATAKNLSRSLQSYISLSIFIGALSTGLGILFATQTNSAAGPIVVLTSVGFYIVSFVFKGK